MITNEPFNVSVNLPFDSVNFTEVFRVEAPAISYTANIRVISMDLTANVSLQLALVPMATAPNTAFTGDQYLQPKNIIIGPNGINGGFLEDTAVIIPQGMKLVARVSATGLVCRAHGLKRINVVTP